MKTTLLEQLAQEVFRAGKPLNEVMNGLLEGLYNNALNKAKTLVREGQPFASVRNALVGDALPPQTATSIAQAAGQLVAKEVADEEQLRKATETAIALYKNRVDYNTCVSALLSQGCGRALAEKIAADNQHYYR